MRHALHGGGAGSDNTDALVLQPREIPEGVAARIVVVPAARVKGVTLERLHARDARQLRTMQWAIRHHDETRFHPVAAIGLDDPARALLVPAQRLHLCLETRVAIEIELLADGTAVLEDLRRARIFLDWHVADLFEQRQVDVGLDIAGRARIAVPIPGAAEIAALLDNADVLDTSFAQTRAGEQSAEAATDHHDFHVVVQRRPRDRLHVRIIEVVRELALYLAVLLVAIRAQALVTLGAVLRLQRLGIEAEPGFVVCG